MWGKRYCAIVASEETLTYEYVVPNGTKLFVERMVGAACNSDNVKVLIKWDDEVIFVTHGTLHECAMPGKCLFYLEGDGVKKVEIVLDNQSAQSEHLMGCVCCS